MRLSSRAGFRIAAVVGVLGALLVPSAASAAITCVFDEATRTVSITGDHDMTLTRSGSDLMVEGGPCLDGTTSATVTNTDLIAVDVGNAAQLMILLTDGPLAPGFSNEPGSSDEIEISVNSQNSMTIVGSGGDDHYVGGSDGFNLNAAEPNDDIDVSGITHTQDATLDGRGGNDILGLRGGSGTGGDVPAVGTLFGGVGNDVLLAARSPDIEGEVVGTYAYGGMGNDRIEGGSFDDVLSGDEDADFLEGFGGGDSLHGGLGLDTASFESATGGVVVDLNGDQAFSSTHTEPIPHIENVTGSRFDDNLYGGTEANTLRGGAGDDTLDGQVGGDQLFGEAGDDYIFGPAASSILNGGQGLDTVDYSDRAMNTINLASGTANSTTGSDTLSQLENTRTNNSVTIIGTSGPNKMTGLTGTLDVFAGGGNDLVIAGGANDTLRGEGGNDRLDPGAGSNAVIGGAGNDVFKLQNGGGDVLTGGTGRDLADFSALIPGTFTLDLRVTTAQDTGSGDRTVSGVEDVVGTRGDDTITGNGLSNGLSGARGDDLLKGEGGNDTITGNQGEDDLFGGAGKDAVSFATAPGGARADLALSGKQDTNFGWDRMQQFENILGSAFADLLSGNSGANTLLGGNGNDRLVGRSGNDTLNGGSGTDSCDGGPGVDKLLSC